MSRAESGVPRGWNEASEEEQEYDDDDIDKNDDDDNVSDAPSFPTQEDLESIIVHPPESVVSVGDVEVRSVSSFNIGMAQNYSASGSTGGGNFMDTTTSSREDNLNRFEYGSAGGGGSSVGGMSEKSDIEHVHPVGRVMITTSMSMSTSMPASLSTSAKTLASLSSSKSSGVGGGLRHDDIHVQDASSDKDSMNHIHMNMNMNLHHNMHIQERVLDTTNLNFLGTETVKSDIATVCSGSVVEDIDLASVGTTAHENSTTNITTNTNMNANNNIPLASPMEREGKRRGVGFATETSTMWTSAHTHTIFPARYSPQLSPTVASLPATSMTLNDMGPPLNRSLLERVGSLSSRAGSVRSFASSTGTPSRPSSVKSFGSVAASEVVHVDTDDCGGSMVESEGQMDLSGALSGCIDDMNSEQSHHDNHHHPSHTTSSSEKSPGRNKTTIDLPVTFSTTTTMTVSAKAVPDEEVKADNNLKLRLSVNNGRMSPGGTVYRGRGIRRYQGRFMNLPMKRFHQSASGGNLNFPLPSIEQPSEKKQLLGNDDRRPRRTEDQVWKRHRGRTWDRDRSRSRSRSHSMDRDQGITIKRQRPRVPISSKSPPPRNLQQSYGESRNHRGSNRQNKNNNTNTNHRRWNVERTNDSPSDSQRYRNNPRRSGGSRGQGDIYTSMTPRGARHGDTARK